MANQYFVGQSVRIAGVFTVNAVATDPTAVTLKVKDPAGTTTTYTYALAQITKDSVGNYHKDVAVTLKGIWYYWWDGDGACDAADQGYFEVLNWLG